MVISLAASWVIAQTLPTLSPQDVADPNRIALTPSLDGRIDPTEWEGFTRDGGTFFQWEPGKIYWAAQARQGNDVVLSYDANGDGWLTGNDNIEVRAHVKDGNVVTTVRRLDATDPNAPRWKDGTIAPEAVAVSAHMTNDYWQAEGEFDLGAGLPEPQEGRKAGVRIDVVPSNFDMGEAYVPRSMTPVRFSFDSSTGLFPGLTWTPKFLTRLFSNEDKLTVRYEFHVAPECPLLKGISVQGDGRAAGFAAFDSPFPALGRDRRAQVTYQSPMNGVKGFGWKVLKTTVTSFDGTPCTLRSSVQVADILTMSANLPDVVTSSTDARIVRADINVWSVSPRPVEGTLKFDVPKEWTITRGREQSFRIVRPRGRVKLPIEFIVPKGTKGYYSIDFDAKVGDHTVRHRQTLLTQ